VSETRACDECGTLYTPRREHDRFCGAVCRKAWNSERTGDHAGGASALLWSVTAMSDTAARLAQVRAADQPRAFAVIGEAVWWVTIVDATLVRHHHDAYDRVLATLDPARRRLTEDTMAGLRFVRNRMGPDVDHVDFIQPAAGITAWTWKSVPEPELGSLSPRGLAWELTRHEAYETRLAGHTIGETFGRATDFLNLAADKAALGPASQARSPVGS
jgi:hypothetical protein